MGIHSQEKSIQKRSMEKYLHYTGQIFAVVGTTEPWLNTAGSLKFSMVWHISYYECQDPSPTQVQPLPISILHFIDIISQSVNPRQQAIIDLSWIAFFFLLQPGEYRKGGNNPIFNPY